MFAMAHKKNEIDTQCKEVITESLCRKIPQSFSSQFTSKEIKRIDYV